MDGPIVKRGPPGPGPGLPIGAYHFARPEGGDATQEALYFLKHARLQAGDMLPMLDLEDPEGLTPAS